MAGLKVGVAHTPPFLTYGAGKRLKRMYLAFVASMSTVMSSRSPSRSNKRTLAADELTSSHRLEIRPPRREKMTSDDGVALNRS